MSHFDAALAAMHRNRAQEGGRILEPVTEVAMRKWERSVGIELPPPLREWMSACGGYAGYPTLYGILDPGQERSRPPGLWESLEERWTSWPSWKRRRLFPIGQDGCGNNFVLMPFEGSWPVAFVDTPVDASEIEYVMASELSIFIEQSCLDELVEDGPWPFDREQTLAIDPALARYEGKLPLPW